MRKLKLDVNALVVESFDTRRADEGIGTVRAHVTDTGPFNQFEDDDSFDLCYGGGANSVGTCIGPTYCCPVSWKPSCYPTQNCGNTCGCYTSAPSCPASCPYEACGL